MEFREFSDSILFYSITLSGTERVLAWYYMLLKMIWAEHLIYGGTKDGIYKDMQSIYSWNFTIVQPLTFPFVGVLSNEWGHVLF